VNDSLESFSVVQCLTDFAVATLFLQFTTDEAMVSLADDSCKGSIPSSRAAPQCFDRSLPAKPFMIISRP
jgi:hypothetical protein